MIRPHAAAFAVIACTLAATAGKAATAEEFYSGKAMTLQVGYAPGGGYDVYARLVARHFSRFIPGRPAMVVQNVPGAGSLRLANLIYNVEPQDGTFIALLGREQVTAPLYRVDGAQFDATKLGWIGSLNRETSVCVAWHSAPFARVEDAREREMVVGGTGPASITVVLPIALNELFGYKFKVIHGYPGGNDVIFALERGELQGRCGWSYSSMLSTRPNWVRDHDIRFLAVTSRARMRELPEVPSLFELATNDEQRQVLDLILANEEMARPLTAPPNVPPDRLRALRNAFSAMVRDGAFLAEAKRLGLDLDPMDSPEMVEMIGQLYSSPASVVNAAKAVIEKAAR